MDMEHPRHVLRRFSPEFKASVVDACKAGLDSVASIALSHGLNANVVHRWIKEDKAGVIWSEPGQDVSIGSYSSEFRQRLVAQSREPGQSATSVALAHGLSPKLVQNWVGRFKRSVASSSWLSLVVDDEAEPPAVKADASRASGQIDIELNGARLSIRGAVDPQSLRVVLETLRC